jgi:hypothetical protein
MLVGGVSVFFLLAVARCGGNGAHFGDAGNGDGSSQGDGPVFQPGDGSSDGAITVDKCHVPPDNVGGDAPACTAPPQPPNSFNPVLKWKWDDPGAGAGSIGVWTIPLVANLTDDDGNGEVNLCDIPDVIVETAGSGEFSRSGKLYMLRGTDGKLESTFGGITVDGDATPAIADLDNDKVPEVLAIDQPGHLMIFDNKGAVKFTGDVTEASTNEYASCGSIGVWDLDGDGTPEIVYGFEVFDNHGKHKWSVQNAGPGFWCPTPTAADLDGDGKLEVIFGNAAYHYDGKLYWSIGGVPGDPQVGNFDSNPDPEILVTRQDGILVLSHDGQIKFGPVQPFDPNTGTLCWNKPGAIHDFDGDGHADLAISSCSTYGIFNVTTTGLTKLWTAPINDSSGIASSTGFDFLGRGIADAVYGDQVALDVFNGKTGASELSQPRSSLTIIEYPTVADVDNDGSADILVVSNAGSYPALQVFQDSQKRWIPTRRIWNQHAYSVVNVREDGTIPAKMGKSWQQLNTFRTNAEIQAGGDCAPPPPNPK